MYQLEKCNLKTFGQAVREARESRGMTREQLAEGLDLSARYIMYIETRGQHPGLQKLYEIATLFNISVDQFFFPDSAINKTTHRRQLDSILDDMGDDDLAVVSATAKALQEIKTQRVQKTEM
jgi:transcriptional regulator with XRE-family HTH domain